MSTVHFHDVAIKFDLDQYQLDMNFIWKISDQIWSVLNLQYLDLILFQDKIYF